VPGAQSKGAGNPSIVNWVGDPATTDSGQAREQIQYTEYIF